MDETVLQKLQSIEDILLHQFTDRTFTKRDITSGPLRFLPQDLSSAVHQPSSPRACEFAANLSSNGNNIRKAENPAVKSKVFSTSKISPVPSARLGRKDAEVNEKISVMLPEDNARWYMIACGSTFSIRWNSMVMALVAFQAISIPYSLAFEAANTTRSEFVETAVDILFIVDFFFQFITTFRDGNDNHITDQRKLTRKYVSSIWFFVDIFASTPFHWFLGKKNIGSQAGIIKTFKVFRLLRLTKILKRMDDIMRATAFRFVRLLAFIYMIIHWVACGQFYILKKYSFADLEMSSGNLYLASTHNAVSMLYGTFQTTSIIQVDMFASAMTIIGSVVQASMFGSVAVMLASFDEDEQRYRRRVHEAASIMCKLNLSDSLKERIILYFESLWNHHRSLNDNIDDFTNLLSPSLAADVKLSLYMDSVQKISFLQSPEISPMFLEAFAMKFTTTIYLKGDLVMRKGEYGDWMGFIGPQGEVAIIDPTKSERTIARTLAEGEYFGEMGLLFELKRTADVEALSWLQLYVMRRVGFLEVKAQYQEDAEFVEGEIERLRKHRKYKIASIRR